MTYQYVNSSTITYTSTAFDNTLQLKSDYNMGEYPLVTVESPTITSLAQYGASIKVTGKNLYDGRVNLSSIPSGYSITKIFTTNTLASGARSTTDGVIIIGYDPPPTSRSINMEFIINGFVRILTLQFVGVQCVVSLENWVMPLNDEAVHWREVS